MPPTPAAPSRPDRPPFECRVRFAGRLSDAVLVDANAPLPPLKPSPPTPQPKSPPPDPSEFWKTDLARELSADRERVEVATQEIRRAITAFREDQAHRLGEMQRVAFELAATMATRFLHERVTAGDFPVETKVRDMLDQIEQGTPATVYLNPDDLKLLEARLGGEPLLPDRSDVRLARDPSLGRGACRVESSEAVLLSDLTRDLQEIRDELLRSLGNARS